MKKGGQEYIDVDEFVYEEIDESDNDYRVTHFDLDRRVDLRNKRVVTIDSDKTMIREDAIHCEQISENCYEIGFHSVDCTDYAKPTVKQVVKALQSYKSNRRNGAVNAIIGSKNRKCFSLDVGRDRRALSIIIKLNSEGKQIENTIIQQSVINVKCNMSYEEFNSLTSNDTASIDNCTDRNKWEYYGAYQTANCGKLNGITLPQLKCDSVNIHNVALILLHHSLANSLTGSEVIHDVGIYINKLVMNFVKHHYNIKAIVLFVSSLS